MTVALQSDIQPTGLNQGDLVRFMQNVRDVVNALRNQSFNRALAKSGLAIGGTTTSYKHTTQVPYVAGGILVLSATTADHAFTGTEVITLDTWGVFLITLSAGGTWKSTPAAATMAYASEALAIAAMPSPPANEAVMGYITIRARSTVNFTAGTTTLTADNGSGNSQTVNYYDGGFDDLPSLTTALTLSKG